MLLKGTLLQLLLLSGFFSTQAQQYLTDGVSGRLISPSAQDNAIAGSPFLLPTWENGMFTFADGRQISTFQLRYDLSTGELQAKNNEVVLIITNPIHAFVLKPANSPELLFQNGFAAVEQQDAKTFYQVLQNGAYRLLKLTRKQIVTLSQYSGPDTREYQSIETYYIAREDGTVVRIRKDKSSVLKALPDSEGKLAAWMSKTGNTCKSEAALAAVIKAFNEKTY